MATFTAVRNKKQTAGTMVNVMKYVTQERKTMLGDQWLVTGHNCVAQSSCLEMMTTKRRFQKTDGRRFYHFVQSFSADDRLTPQQVNAIGVEFAQIQFPDFEVIVATHVDTGHLHNHLVVNSVSCANGRKLHQNAADLQRHRQVNDQIGDLTVLPVLCVCKNRGQGGTTMLDQLPVKRCLYCGGEDIGIGWQHGDALVTFKKHGLMGDRLQYLICRRCGAVLYQCVAEPHKFPQAR